MPPELNNSQGIEAAILTVAQALTPRNDGTSFSNSEVDTGTKWLDGKTIFKKTINLGSLPNSSSIAVAHSITGLTKVVEYRGIGMNLGGLQFIDFQQGNGINTYIDATNVNIATTIARSSFTGWMTIWYTK